MNNPKVSIIVAVYKAESYLHRCLDSLLNQTFQDYEVLLVDDGSPDMSGKICDDYANKDSRVRVIHKENGGVSSARQCGIDNAKGEYVIHADPDDWVEQDMLYELYNNAIEHDADMVFCDFYVNYEHNSLQTYRSQTPKDLDCDTIIQGMFSNLHGSSWNKLIKRNCLVKFNVKYPLELSFCEDLYVNLALLKNNIIVSYIPKAFYHYVYDLNQDSLCRTYTLNTPHRDIEMKNILVNLLSDTIHKHDCENYLSYLIVSRAFNANVLNSTMFKSFFYDCKNTLIYYKHGKILNKYFFYLACIGLYRISFKIRSLLCAMNKMGIRH